MKIMTLSLYGLGKDDGGEDGRGQGWARTRMRPRMGEKRTEHVGDGHGWTRHKCVWVNVGVEEG